MLCGIIMRTGLPELKKKAPHFGMMARLLNRPLQLSASSVPSLSHSLARAYEIDRSPARPRNAMRFALISKTPLQRRAANGRRGMNGFFQLFVERRCLRLRHIGDRRGNHDTGKRLLMVRQW